jgi:hypothetical protein
MTAFFTWLSRTVFVAALDRTAKPCNPSTFAGEPGGQRYPDGRRWLLYVIEEGYDRADLH